MVKRLMGLALPLAMLAGCSGGDRVVMASEQARTISVTGEGSSRGAPDQATMQFAVVTQGNTARAAMAANAEAMTNVRDALLALEIERADIQTQTITLNPRYAEDDRGRINTSEIVGYEARNGLMVRLRQIDQVGAAIDAATGAGANGMDGLSFGFADPDEMVETARIAAMEDARETAALLAREAGVRLGAPVTISLSGGRPDPRPMMRQSSFSMDMAESTPVEAGESEIRVIASVVYAID